MQKTKKGLGRGLDALIGPTNGVSATEKIETSSGVLDIDINKIEPNKDQPRKNFEEEALIELSESIKNYGIIQPLLVKDEGGYYSIIAGERRWRAARIAKLNKIPVIIKDYNEAEKIQIALIENIQRQDLNPIEEAECYKRLSEEYFFSQEDIAAKLGKKRATISSYMGLLNLDVRVKGLLTEGKLSVAHGNKLLSLEDPDDQFRTAEHIVGESLSVREADANIKFLIEQKQMAEKTKKPELIVRHIVKKSYKNLESDLKSIFGTKVNIKDGKNKGKIEIEYYSEDELDRLIGRMKGLQNV